MFPNLSRHNLGNRNLMQRVGFCKLRLGHRARGVQVSDGQNLLCGQFRTAHAFTFGVSILLDRIMNVIAFSSNKDVRRIYASRIIACMAAAQSFLDWAVREHPCYTVGLHSLFSSNNPYNTISEWINGGSPKPTRICFSYFIPEAFCK